MVKILQAIALVKRSASITHTKHFDENKCLACNICLMFTSQEINQPNGHLIIDGSLSENSAIGKTQDNVTHVNCLLVPWSTEASYTK